MRSKAPMKPLTHHRCRLVIGIVLLLTGTISQVHAEDCAKSKEYYTRGTEIINYKDRLAVFQKAVDLCPLYAEAHVNLADALENLGMLKGEFSQEGLGRQNDLLDKAVGEYQKALEINKELTAAYQGLADIYTVQGRLELALSAYNQILARSPGHEKGLQSANRLKALIASQPGGFKKAEEIVRQSVASQSSDGTRTMGFQDNTVVKARQIFDNILFEGWSAAIKPGEPNLQLSEIGQALSSPELSSFNYIIEGHANKVGGLDENLSLSRQRAEAVKSFLVNNYTISPGRLLTQGFGYSRPRYPDSTNSGNRRVEISFIGKPGEDIGN